MKILMIDNYDSFTYNLVHMMESLDGVDVTVVRNDEVDLSSVDTYSKIVLSPGPGIPLEAGLMPELVRRYAPAKSILGVCLGHQCIGEVFGGTLHNLASPVHGKATSAQVIDASESLFKGLSSELTVGRYHSWVVARENFPEDLIITAVDAEGQIMALRHRSFDVRGVQFHPESILTPQGKEILANWIHHESRS